MTNTKTTATLDQLLTDISNSNNITLIVEHGDLTLTQGDLTGDCLTYVADKNWIVAIYNDFDCSIPIVGNISLIESKDFNDSPLHLYTLRYQGVTVTFSIR